MATGRILQKKISHSDQVDALANDTSRVIYTWSLAHLNQWGCFHGNARKIKALVVPLRDDITVEMVKEYMEDWKAKGLVVAYNVNGTDCVNEYLFYPSFFTNQPGLRFDREGKSDIPRPPDDLLRKFLPQQWWKKAGVTAGK